MFTKVGDSLVHFKFEEHAENPDCNFCMLSDYGSLTYLKKRDIVYTDYMLNVVNSYSVNNLIDLGVNTVCLSSELTLSKLEDMVSKTDVNSLEVLIYGRVELAKMKYDPAPDVEDAILVDRNGCKYPIRRGKKLNYLMSPNPINRVHEIDKLKEMGIKNYRVDFFLETGIECEKILSNIHKNIF